MQFLEDIHTSQFLKDIHTSCCKDIHTSQVFGLCQAYIEAQLRLSRPCEVHLNTCECQEFKAVGEAVKEVVEEQVIGKRSARRGRGLISCEKFRSLPHLVCETRQRCGLVSTDRGLVTTPVKHLPSVETEV